MRRKKWLIPLPGKISDRIRSGEIAAGRVERAPEKASTDAVKRAKGQGLGKGASTRGGKKGAS